MRSSQQASGESIFTNSSQDETPKPRRWKLLKDLPGCPAGTIGIEDLTGSRYHQVNFGCGQNLKFTLLYVEVNPDWFEEIKPKRVLVIEFELEEEETGARYVAVERNRLPNRMIYVDRIDQRIEER
jgi:hypothetical protein